MKITLHIGAHATDGEKLLRSLIRNSDTLTEHGILVPGPSKFRNIMRDAATRLKGEVASPETCELVLDEIMDDHKADHLVLSYDQFMSGVGMIMAGGGYYARADRTAWLRNIFPGHEVRFAMGLRNPATHVPAVYKHVGDRSFDAFMQGVSPLDMLWSRPVKQILAANPGSPLILWCNEDTPLIWPEIMRTVADCPPEVGLRGGLDVIQTILQPDGLKRLVAYLQTNPAQNDQQRRRILTAFLERYALIDELEEEVDLPGFTAEVVEEMTRIYDEDCDYIQTIPGVTFIS